MTYYVPDFDEIRAFERRAQEIRAAECARLARGAITWLRDLLHVGGHHHGHPAVEGGAGLASGAGEPDMVKRGGQPSPVAAATA